MFLFNLKLGTFVLLFYQCSFFYVYIGRFLLIFNILFIHVVLFFTSCLFVFEAFINIVN